MANDHGVPVPRLAILLSGPILSVTSGATGPTFVERLTGTDFGV